MHKIRENFYNNCTLDGILKNCDFIAKHSNSRNIIASFLFTLFIFFLFIFCLRAIYPPIDFSSISGFIKSLFNALTKSEVYGYVLSYGIFIVSLILGMNFGFMLNNAIDVKHLMKRYKDDFTNWNYIKNKDLKSIVFSPFCKDNKYHIVTNKLLDKHKEIFICEYLKNNNTNIFEILIEYNYMELESKNKELETRSYKEIFIIFMSTLLSNTIALSLQFLQKLKINSNQVINYIIVAIIIFAIIYYAIKIISIIRDKFLAIIWNSYEYKEITKMKQFHNFLVDAQIELLSKRNPLPCTSCKMLRKSKNKRIYR